MTNLDKLKNDILTVEGQIKEITQLKNHIDNRLAILEADLELLLLKRNMLVSIPQPKNKQNGPTNTDMNERDPSPSPRHASP